MSDKYDAAIAYARDLGAQHGRNAAEWYAQDAFGGRVTRGADENARRVAQGITDGDPDILDNLPYPDLSGQWADSLTGPQLVRDAWEAAGEDVDDIYRLAGRRDVDDGFSDICEAYEDAFSLAAQAEVDRLARLAF